MSELFAEIKPSCVGLLRFATLTPASIPNALKFLIEIISILRVHSAQLPRLSRSLVSYIFFPVSSILQRNSLSSIPDQVLEKILIVLGFLSESWWWHEEVTIWEQIFMLCGSVLGGMANKGKGKERDEEVKEAAAQCLYTLLRGRDGNFIQLPKLRDHSRSPRFIPIFGQTLSAIINTTESPSLSLQRISLKVLRILLDTYASDNLFPMVLPGVMSSISKVALGTNLEKQWANGEIVVDALLVMQIAIIRSVGDEICIKEGVLHSIEDLEDLAELVSPSTVQSSQNNSQPPFPTRRSVSWLRGTASQLHIAINNLHSLVVHPNPDALRSLALFSRAVLQATPQSLPQTQPLLLTFLLSLSNSSFPMVASDAQTHLSDLLSSSSKIQSTLLSALVQNLSQNLLALSRLVSIHEESKIRHLSGLIEATCRLASVRQEEGDHPGVSIAKGIGKLLGPSGGIEKWGWNFLPVFEFVEQPIAIAPTSTEQLMLENDPEHLHWTPFPSFQLKHLNRDTLVALEQMFRALGAAGGETCLYSVEWFVGIGKAGTDQNAVAALWCACRLLEGLSGINFSSEDGPDHILPKATKRLERLARSLARSLPEMWDYQSDDVETSTTSSQELRDGDDSSLMEYRKGLEPMHENLKIIRTSPVRVFEKTDQPINHRAISLQIISGCVGVLQARSSSLFIHVLYPVLHSLVSQAPFLASTAYASLQYMTVASSYASPANLLLSNFDYALDSISRRLTRRWLDVDATQVLVMLVRLVGSDVVEKAGDVVEECFDRLDEYHGYDILVEGLVNVLTEVTRVLKNDSIPVERGGKEPRYTPYAQLSTLSDFFLWYHKRQKRDNETNDDIDYGPAPRRAWGEEKVTAEEKGEEKEAMANAADPDAEPTPTATQALTKQIVNRSLYFLTHGSPVIRARILSLLASSVYSLPASALMPAIHSAWPFILNRLADRETFVVSEAASLVEALSTYTGEFMFRRIWDDVWPRFKTLLSQLQAGDAASALVKRTPVAVGTESAYTHSHRLYRSIIKTMTAALQDVHTHENSFWEVLLLFRRFLHNAVHPELQQAAQKLYKVAKIQNADSVWLVLISTAQQDHPVLSFMYQPKLDISVNVDAIMRNS